MIKTYSQMLDNKDGIESNIETEATRKIKMSKN